MPFSDAQLDSLAVSRDIAGRLLGQKKDWLDQCFERTRSLQSTHGQRIDWLNSESDQLYRQMGDAFERSKSAFSMRDHGGASSWAAQGRQYKARLQEANAEKRRLIDIIKAGQAKFVKARDDYRKAKAEHEQATGTFNERLTYLKQRSAKERATQQAELDAKAKQRKAEQEKASKARQKERDARDEAKRRRAADMQKRFGDGTVGGDRNWLPPIHALMASDNRPITISFGRGPRADESLVADGHIGMKDFYQRGRVGHDHFLKDGRVASKTDRYRFKQP